MLVMDMISGLAIRGLLALSGGFAAKEAVVSKLGLENPALLVTLPLSIIKHNVAPSSEDHQFNCPYRQKLHEKCSNVSLFDKRTIPPVNIALDQKNIPLTKESYKAIVQDIKHTQQKNPVDTLRKEVAHIKQQVFNQRDIAMNFSMAGEKEGALLHSVLANGFALKGEVLKNSSIINEYAMEKPW
jgi:hypothetical protein